MQLILNIFMLLYVVCFTVNNTQLRESTFYSERLTSRVPVPATVFSLRFGGQVKAV